MLAATWRYPQPFSENYHLWQNLDLPVWSYDETTVTALENVIITKSEEVDQSKSKLKATLTMFSDITGVILEEWVPEGTTEFLFPKQVTK